MVGGSARRVLIVSVLALACAPNAFADDSLLGSVSGATGEVVVGEVLEVPAPVSVEVPAVPVPPVVAVEVPAVPVPTVPNPDVPAVSAPAAVKVVKDGTERVEQALPPLPKPDAVLATVAETVAEATRAVVPTASAPRVEAAPPRPHVTKRARTARAGAVRVTIPVTTPSRGRPVARAESRKPVVAAAPTAPTAAADDASIRPARDAAAREATPVASEKLVHTPVRPQAARERSGPLPIPSPPGRISTTGAAAGGAEGFWPVCAGLLLLVLLGRRLGPRVLQLVPEPHPHAFLLRLERPG